ncbi:uncharacterized protein [Chelonus insularis]|uniref:uncharacterized protein n=1 Tax=Chelonus insularis TaxID=460826 RepID=UPI00158B71BB|nr:uncharacterized protein LOC118063930 [Chelonus insularis]
MENLKRFLCNLETFNEIQQDYASNEDKIRDISAKTMQEGINNLQDSKDQFKSEIEANLKYITSSKHVIEKRQDLVCNENTGLSVSNIRNDAMIEFTKDAMTLLNKFGNRDSIKSSQLDNNLTYIIEAVKLYNENIAKSVRKEKISIDDVESAMKSIHILSDSYRQIAIHDDDTPMDLSIIEFEKSQI